MIAEVSFFYLVCFLRDFAVCLALILRFNFALPKVGFQANNATQRNYPGSRANA